jgi:hypothetical protein
MISKIAIRVVALLGAAWSIGPACASTSQGTDSNTHWIECKTVAQCPNATSFACVGGHCVSASGDSGTPSTSGPCPIGVAGNDPCDGTIAQCWTACVSGSRGQFVCSEGTWVAGQGLFPCGQGNGSGGSAGADLDAALAGGPGAGGAAGTGATRGGSAGKGGTRFDVGRSDGGRADAGRCAPMDAHTGSLPCVSIVGYTWTGSDCAPVVCNCEGADCASMYATEAECRNARVDCGATPVISTACERNSDCVLAERTCCACGEPSARDKVAMNAASQSAWYASICKDLPPCPPCAPLPGPLQAVCVAGQCEVQNFQQEKGCLASQFCEVKPVDCCACGQLTSRNEVVALGTGYTMRGCSASCPPCSGVELPPGITASCYLSGGYCVLD